MNSRSPDYKNMIYRRAGQSGLKLPAISLGMWHNFGAIDDFNTARDIILKAFDSGITHFDLANNYGTPPGTAEEIFGRIIKEELASHRDEMIISTKAGYKMWEGPYGDGGSRKYLLSSLDQSLKRLKLDYVDIFYSHRPDHETPAAETMMALDHAVRSGKTLYAGISNYSDKQTKEAAEIMNDLGTPLLLNQVRYSMLDRWAEDGLLDTLEENGIGCIAFSPLEQGLLTSKYLEGIPSGSRAGRKDGFLQPEDITDEKRAIIRQLDRIAKSRGNSLACMAIAWLLKDKRVTSVLIGARSVAQLEENIGSLRCRNFSDDEIGEINSVLEPINKTL